MLSVAGPRCHQGKWMLTGVLLMNETESWKLFIISLQPVLFHIYEILYEALNSINSLWRKTFTPMKKIVKMRTQLCVF